MVLNQERLPLCEALETYCETTGARFHMPGHKGDTSMLPGIFPLKWDVENVPELGHLYGLNGPIAEAEKLAADAFGAKHTFFMTNGVAQGVFAMLAAAVKEGEQLLVGRDAHRSVLRAMVLLGIEPVWLPIPTDDRTGLPGALTADTVREYAKANPNAKALFVTYPNYFGLCGDIEAIVKAAKECGLKVLVDESHGAHFTFHDMLPVSAGQAGADFWVHAAYRTLPVLTQGTYLHMAKDEASLDVRRAMVLGGMSSPNYLILASMDMARRKMALEGGGMINECLPLLLELNRDVDDLDTLQIPRVTGRAGVKDVDPMRITISVVGLGITGYEAAQWLREHHGIQVTMADPRHLVVIVTGADTPASIAALSSALGQLSRAFVARRPVQMPRYSGLEIPEKVMSLRAAAMSPTEEILLRDAAGRTAAASFGTYPPGIPAVCPGEVITQQLIDALEFTREQMNGRLFGVLDDRITVVK